MKQETANLNLEGRKALEAAQARVLDLNRELASLTKRVQDQVQENKEMREYYQQCEADRRDREIVLLGDRDALTRALEVCARRLASPIADKDPSRGGWRAVSALGPNPILEHFNKAGAFRP